MTLEEMSAEMFLKPEQYLSSALDGWDKRPDAKKLAYEKGLKTGREATKFSVAVNNVWSCDCKNGGFLSSYEKLGYHAHTASFFRGVLDSGCPVYVYRRGRKDAVKIA